jgi:transcriptional regulator with XRE-family HTH domain
VTLSEALSAERQRQGVSRYELARRTGLPRSRVNAILGGDTPNPGVLTLLKILAALERDLAWLGKQLGEPK